MGRNYLEMLDSVHISKPIELKEIDYAIQDQENKKEKKIHKEKMPKGKCTPSDLVDIITVGGTRHNFRKRLYFWKRVFLESSKQSGRMASRCDCRRIRPEAQRCRRIFSPF